MMNEYVFDEDTNIANQRVSKEEKALQKISNISTKIIRRGK